MKEHVLNIKGERYQFFRMGNGKKRLVLLHGLAADKGVMAELCKPLTKRYTCLILDLPGHNGIEMDGIVNLDSYAKYVKSLVDRIGWKRFGIVGFSFGGVVGLRLSRLYYMQKRTVPLVMWATPLQSEISKVTWPIRILIVLTGMLPCGVFRWVSFRKWVSDMGNLEGIKLPRTALRSITRFDNKSMKIVSRIMKDEAKLDEGNVKKLLVYGTRDKLVDLDFNFIIGDHNIKNASFRIVENGGHFGTREGQKEAMRQIIEFFDLSY